MKKFFVSFAVISAFCFLFAPAISMAATFVSEYDIVSDTVWTKEASPYVVNQNMYIESGTTLIIMPGVVVKFANNSGIVADGNIIANGNKNEQIYFTSFADDSVGGDTNSDYDSTIPQKGDVSIVSLSPMSSLSELSFVNFKYLGMGLNIEGLNKIFENLSLSDISSGINIIGNSSITLNNLKIKDVESEAVSAYESSMVFLNNSTIENILFNEAIGIYDGSSLAMYKTDVKNMSIWGTMIGIYGSTASVFDSEISLGQGDGIGVYDNWDGTKSSVVILRTKISDFSSSGIYVSGSNLEIKNSIISGNDVGIGAYLSSIKAEENNISGNVWRGVDEYESVLAEAKNNFWGDITGPKNETNNPTGLGDEVSDGVVFIPWLTEDPTLKPKCCSSVAFLPGLEASRLYKPGLIFENQIWEPNRNADVENLFLDSLGKSLDNSIYTRDVIEEINFTGINVYKDFIGEMNLLKTGDKITDFKVFPYDWRLDLNDIIDDGVKIDSAGTVEKMIPEIEKMAKNSKTGKVALIGHSNGGLVAKLLMKKLEEQGKADLIDKLILIASPELGTPKAIAGILHGYGQDILKGMILSKAVARKMGENMPGGYQLLPSAKYFEKVADPVIKFDSSLDGLNNFYSSYGEDISSASELSDFFLAVKDGRVVLDTSVDQPLVLNSKLLEKSKNIHDVIDNYNAPENVKVVQIVGWGLDTVKAIEYYVKSKIICVDRGVCNTQKFLDYRPIFTEDGDETVVTASADAMPVETYYLDLYNHNKLERNRRHLNITESKSVIDIVKNQITGVATTTNFITNTKPIPKNEDKRLRLSGHSPISIDLYDEHGNHTGIIQKPDSDIQYIEENIPNSYYLSFGEGKYVGFDVNSSTSVKILGTGIGTFTLNVEEFSGGQIASNSSYEDIPVLPTTVAVFSNTDGTNKLEVDLDGDGANDFNLKPLEAFGPIQYLQVMKKVINEFDMKNKEKKSLLNKIDIIIKMLQKGKSKGVNERIARFLHGIQKDGKKHKKMNSSDQEIIVRMFNNLLDSLK